jgi:4-amino-4-deoxy-L-arabinose transferase-like glycosyltransferase
MNSEEMIVKADRNYRRKLFSGYLIVIILGILIWNFIRPPFLNILDNLPNKERVEIKEIIAHLFLLSFIPMAIYLITIGRRICRYNAMPYPGMKVIRDTVVVTGKKAIFRGKSLIILGIVVIILLITSMITTHVIILRFKQAPLFSPVFYGRSI